MSSRPLIAIIEDDKVLGKSLQQRFNLEGYQANWLRTANDAERILSLRPPRLVLSDIRLPDGSGEEVMGRLFTRHGIIPTIFMTAYGEIEQAVRLVKGGARDYIAKPFDLDELVARVKEIVPLEDHSNSDPYSCFGISQATAALRHVLERVADKDVTVLLEGETGTGKDLAARFLHAAGQRRADPFVSVNCASIPESLFESTIFGHEKGAFTDASSRQIGLAEQAGTGTLFFDEIGEIEPAAQAKLLHLIENREFRRLGGRATLHCKARFIFATNRDLEQEVADGRFREDLWFRINVINCKVPPLRDRTEEIEPLIRYYLRSMAQRLKVPVPEIADEVFIQARVAPWRGNIRELVNRVERAVALSDSGVIGVNDFWPDRQVTTVARSGSQPGATLEDVRQAAEREHIRKTLAATEGRIQEAAEQLGVSRTTLWERIRRYGLQSETQK